MRRNTFMKLQLSLLMGLGVFVSAVRVSDARTEQAKQAKGPQNVTPQSLPGQPGYYGYTQTPWFGSQGIQKQLNLSNEQISKMNQAYGEHWNQYSKGLDTLSTLNEKERAQKLQEMSHDFNGRVGRSAQGVLNAEQIRRYQQLNLQHQGLNAFYNPDIQQSLKLTQGQQQQLRDLSTKQNQELTQIQAHAAQDPAFAAREFLQYRQNYDQRLNSILDNQQRQAWREMTGEPYDFTPEGLQSKK